MKPLRIAHLSDTHLGYRALDIADPESGRNQRSIDIERSFEAAISNILEQDVDLVIHSGDLFHHTRPAFSAIQCAISQFRRLESRSIPVVVIGGNHDTPRLRTSGSVFQLLDLAVEGAHFLGGYEQVSIPFESLDLVVAAVPHGKLTDLEPPFVFPAPGKRNILVTHGFVPGSDLYRGEPGEEEVGADLLMPDFDYIALGHYHVSSQARKNAWYAGSTERMGWGDEPVQPGFLLVEVRDSLEAEHVSVPHRPMKTFRPTPEELEHLDADQIARLALEWLKSLDSNESMTRIVIDQVERPVKREVTSTVQRQSRELAWSVQVTGRIAEHSGLTLDRSELPSLDLPVLFETFVRARREDGQFDEQFAADFLKIGSEEIHSAARLLEEEAAIGDDGT